MQTTTARLLQTSSPSYRSDAKHSKSVKLSIQLAVQRVTTPTLGAGKVPRCLLRPFSQILRSFVLSTFQRVACHSCHSLLLSRPRFFPRLFHATEPCVVGRDSCHHWVCCCCCCKVLLLQTLLLLRAAAADLVVILK